jgi:phosphoribosyl-AMP cyclohydrolase
MIALHFVDGLIPVVVQDARTREVLMVAYANAEAVQKTRETGFAHYYSRSRKKLWKKGEESGHVQRVQEIRVDCDEDCLLYLVEQEGAACHTGYRSCFYRTIEGTIISEKVFDPSKVYANKGQ